MNIDLVFNAAVVGFLTPVVIGLVEVVKRWADNSKIAPVISILFGVGLYWLVLPRVPASEFVIGGIIIGLMASGLYSGGKTLISTDQPS